MTKKIMKEMKFDNELELVEHEKCPVCGILISLDAFKDEPSRREYHISGLCQHCQDMAFK